MTEICMLCSTSKEEKPFAEPETSIASRICVSCAKHFQQSNSPAVLKVFAEKIGAPLLVMQAEPRQVFTANDKALALFKKKLGEIEQHRGGLVFDCIHAFSEAGCGRDAHCEPCAIKNAIVETLTTGKAFANVSAVLDTRKDGRETRHELRISTEKTGEMALVRIHEYKPAP